MKKILAAAALVAGGAFGARAQDDKARVYVVDVERLKQIERADAVKHFRENFDQYNDANFIELMLIGDGPRIVAYTGPTFPGMPVNEHVVIGGANKNGDKYYTRDETDMITLIRRNDGDGNILDEAHAHLMPDGSSYVEVKRGVIMGDNVMYGVDEYYFMPKDAGLNGMVQLLQKHNPACVPAYKPPENRARNGGGNVVMRLQP